MLSGAAMVRSELQTAEKRRVDSLVRLMSEMIADSCEKAGIPREATPFGRPSNFVALLAADALHLVVDQTRAGPIAAQRYLDRRSVSKISAGSLGDQAVGELGYVHPITLSFPSAILILEPDEQRQAMTASIGEVVEVLVQRDILRKLALPESYAHLRDLFPSFLQDHPHRDRNVFVMMRIRNTQQHEQIMQQLRTHLGKHGFDLMRADDKSYSEDLWDNVCIYMLGCHYGIAVFEEIDEREFNPNIAIELGFMMAMGKRCLIMKDSRMPRMPTDIVGRLYKKFDTYDIVGTIPRVVQGWVHDLGFD